MKKVILAVIVFLLLVNCGCQDSQKATSGDTSSLGGLYLKPAGIVTRWSSAENWKGEKGAAGKANAGRKGSPKFTLKAGQRQVLAEVKGKSGMVRRIWITINDRSPEMLRGIKLDMYWDGAKRPAVSVPIGDFFCHNIGRMARFQSALFSSPEARSFNCCIPMPFKKGMKVVVTNETDTDLKSMYFDVDYTIGDKHPANMLYFHAHYRRENPTALKEDYEFLPRVYGRGRFLGASVGIIADQEEYFQSWWGEGEVKVYIDGDEEYPTLCGTGTEDYIGTAWGQGQYDNLYQGCHIADRENMQYGFYRLHVPDPIYFDKDVRVTIQQIGYAGKAKEQMRKAGKTVYKAGAGLVKIDLNKPGKMGLFERRDDWSSCAYFYLDRPTSNLPAIDPLEKRLIKK
ncbi:MAG: glycoside hydrolase family 172 protein [Planctomycetota bacterium]|jgi:hypothetical protein